MQSSKLGFDSMVKESARQGLRYTLGAGGLEVFISDGAHNFAEANIKEYWTRYKDDRTEHIKHVHMAGDNNNNKMEAFNGELIDREKVMRSLKRDNSPILKGMQIYHNFIRPHMGLDGDTPSERAGIKVEGENK
jgi:hypothetical protein